MKQTIVVNTTEARQNFFKLLSAVATGADVTVIKKDANLRFKLTLETEPEVDKEEIMAKWRSLKLTNVPSPSKLKKILTERYSRIV